MEERESYIKTIISFMIREIEDRNIDKYFFEFRIYFEDILEKYNGTGEGIIHQVQDLKNYNIVFVEKWKYQFKLQLQTIFTYMSSKDIEKIVYNFFKSLESYIVEKDEEDLKNIIAKFNKKE